MSSIVCSTRLTVPPFLTPANASRLTTWIGTADAHARARAQAQEVDVQRLVGDDVELIVARQHALLAAFDVELEDRGEEVTGVNELVEFLVLDRDRLGFLAAAINNAGYAASRRTKRAAPLPVPLRVTAASCLIAAMSCFPSVAPPRLQGCRKRREARAYRGRG